MNCQCYSRYIEQTNRSTMIYDFKVYFAFQILFLRQILPHDERQRNETFPTGFRRNHLTRCKANKNDFTTIV